MEVTVKPYLASWLEKPSNASWLRKVLASKEGILLMSVLSEMAKPAEDFVSINSVSTEVMNKMALNHVLCSGQELAISRIRLLATEQVNPQELPDPWTGDPES